MYKILLIEDFQVIQEMYEQVLKQSGFEVDVTSDGNEALEKVKLKTYDLILLDMLLPQVNGIDFLQKFKDRGNTKIIALSDFDYKDTVKQAFELGVSKYWIKADNTPYTLVEKLKEFLGGDNTTDEDHSTPPATPAAI
jgi:DNA-binding response OmpR family regulator